MQFNCLVNIFVGRKIGKKEEKRKTFFKLFILSWRNIDSLPAIHIPLLFYRSSKKISRYEINTDNNHIDNYDKTSQRIAKHWTRRDG